MTSTPDTPLPSTPAVSLNTRDVTADFLALLGDAAAVVRPVSADNVEHAIQLSHEGVVPWRLWLHQGTLDAADKQALTEIAEATRYIHSLGFVREILTPVVILSGAQVDLNHRRVVGLHVLPAEHVSPEKVIFHFHSALPPPTDLKALAPAFDAVIHQVSPVDGDLVVLQLKGDNIPMRQLQAFRRHLFEHSQRELARTGKTVHYLALAGGDLDVHLFRPEDRAMVKAALERAMATESVPALAEPTPILFNGRPVSTTAVLLDYVTALELFTLERPAVMDTDVLWTVTYKNGSADHREGILGPNDKAVPIVPGMVINVANTGSA